MIPEKQQQLRASQASCPVNMNGGGAGKGSSPSGSRWTRTVFMVLLALAFVALATWTLVTYSLRLVALQERVTALETQCQLNEQNVQKYIDDKLDAILQEVSEFRVWVVHQASKMFLLQILQNNFTSAGHPCLGTKNVLQIHNFFPAQNARIWDKQKVCGHLLSVDLVHFVSNRNWKESLRKIRIFEFGMTTKLISWPPKLRQSDPLSSLYGVTIPPTQFLFQLEFWHSRCFPHVFGFTALKGASSCLFLGRTALTGAVPVSLLVVVVVVYDSP